MNVSRSSWNNFGFYSSNGTTAYKDTLDKCVLSAVCGNLKYDFEWMVSTNFYHIVQIWQHYSIQVAF